MKHITRLFAAIVMLSMTLGAKSQTANLLPKPQEMTVGGAAFTLGGEVRVTNPTGNVMLQEFLTENGFTASSSASRSITVSIVSAIDGAYDYELAGFENEAYTLSVTADAITITALNNTGVCRAAATLMQLASNGSIEGVTIKDYPAFKLRGYMHDVGRSFITVEELKNEIKKFARFKVNCFHWHLTENQAWRFEVLAYPQLTSASSMTRFAGQYYTQAECREIDQLCHEYGVVLIPEIDMPGHSAAFTRAMGHNMQTDDGFAELQTILEEAADVFTHAPYIHIGGDEVTITRANFLQDMIAKVKRLGKRAVVWNPINGVNVSGLDADMVQCWGTRGTKISGKVNIDCRYNYTNHFDVFADLAGIYLSNILYQSRGNAEVAGELSCPWNDRKTPTQEDIIKQNNHWANVIASASRAWIGGGEGYIETQGAVLPNSGTQYDDFADWERRFLHWKSSAWLNSEPIPYVKQTDVRWRITDMIPSTAADQIDPTATPQDVITIDEQTYGTRIVTGAGIYLNHTWGTTVPGIYPGAAYGNTVYAWTYVYSPVAQDAGALIEFYNYGRSENDAAAAAGQWDKMGSRIWLNDTELTAPSWQNAGRSVGAEDDLQDENFTARAPYAIHLNQGWNKVFVKLPYTNASYRLHKWMWTFVVTDTEGRNALDGLTYSPSQSADDEAASLSLYISEVETDINSKVGDRIGDYAQSNADAIRALIAEIKATLTTPRTATERAAQRAQIEAAYAAFVASCTDATINLPVSSTTSNVKWYSLKSKRNSKYATCGDAGANVTGEGTLGESACWKFVKRADGSFNIISRSGLYISPASANNTALKAVAAEPAAGWSIARAETDGYVIIKSGTAQFNQTTKTGTPVYNWGGGSNTTDDGCQYIVAEATRVPLSSIEASNSIESHYYYMYTPNRGNRYPTAKGAGQAVVGETTVTDAAAWKFVTRADGTYDIVSYTDGTYISPASSYDSALNTVAARPSAGWTLERSGNYWLIYSGTTAQFNQTNNSTLGFKVYNWGNQGTVNTSDTGCQYVIVDADVEVEEITVDQNLPQAGKRYYIAAQTWDGTQWVEKFLNNKSGGTENCGTVLPEATTWLCEGEEGAWTFKSLTTNKYLCHGGARDAATCVVAYPTGNYNPPLGSVTIKSTTGTETRFLIARQDGSNIQSGDKSNAETGCPPKTNTGAANTYTPYFCLYETTGLPEVGKTYYISALIDKSNNSNYSHYYIRNESGTTFSWPEVNALDEANQWLCEDSGTEGKVFFKNVKTGKYLGHKVLQNNGLAFTVTDQSSKYNGYACLTSSASTSSYLVVKEASGWDQASGLFDPHTTNFSTYYRFEDVAKTAQTKASLIINTNLTTGAVFQNGGVDLAANVITFERGNADITLSVKAGSYDNSVYTFDGFYDINGTLLGQTYTVPAETTTDLIITARFSYSIISQNYGDKWLRLYNGENNAHYATLYTAGSEKRAKTQGLDFSMQEQLWCFVGTAEGFKIYNMATGNTMAMTIDAAAAAESGTFQMQTVNEENAAKQLWKVELVDGKFCIVSSTLTGQGWNPHGGMGNQLKFWRTSATGSQWLISTAPSTPKTLSIAFNEREQASSNNTKLGTLTIVSEGRTGNTVCTMADLAENTPSTKSLYINSGTIAYNASGDTYDGYTATLNGAALGATAVELGETNNVEFHVDQNSKAVYVYYNNDNPGNVPFRIPAIATFPDGTLLAVTDMRTCGNDIGYGRVDLWCKTSTDNGLTWGENQVIVEGNGTTAANATEANPLWKCGFGDAALCVDGNEILLMCVGGRAVYGQGSATNRNAMVRIRGTYNPTTKAIAWGEPENQSQQFFDLMPENAYTMFIGSGRLFQSRMTRAEGAEHNRVYAALLCLNNGNIVVYSDDFGATWHILGNASDRPAPGGNEPKCEELPDGSVILSSRNPYKRIFNIFRYNEGSLTEGAWGSPVAGLAQSDGPNGTNGDIFYATVSHPVYPEIKHHYMLQSVPAGPGRANVKVYRKRIDPNTVYTSATIATGWEVAVQVSYKGSAYSAITRLNDNSYGVFYEEVPGGYCMVYKNYSEAEMLGTQDWSADITSPVVTFRTPKDENDNRTYATLYSQYHIALPDGAKAYVCDEAGDGRMHLEPIDGNVVPRLTPVVVVGPSTLTTETLPVLQEVVDAYDGTNLLLGTLTQKTAAELLAEHEATGMTVYGLSGAFGKIGFFQNAPAAIMTAGRAFYIADPAQAEASQSNASVRGFTFDPDNGTATGLDIIDAIDRTQTGEAYDLTGRRVGAVKRNHIYIINGQKTLVR